MGASLTRSKQKFGLQLKASLENITDVTADGTDFRFYVKLKCPNCGEISPDWVYICAEESTEVKGGRGTANFVGKCKFCSRQHSVDILPELAAPYRAESSESFATIAGFEARGTEPVEFDARVGWTGRGVESGTLFDDVDLGEKEWVDYDEKAGQSAGIYGVESRFVTL